ncbi:hypothetical protein CRG98_028123 [Punica granatum]|uniref:Uncharacterized protein n=1 Tax=Punica granatum TaxID=22663 RepID=A0A2I0J683_PUNGR|nr:hypothetical protein CRG98_028123 [Punica granatum]
MKVVMTKKLVDYVRPSQIIIAEDCFQLLSIPKDRVAQVLAKSVEKTFGGHVVKKTTLGDYVKDNVPSLDCFMSKGDIGRRWKGLLGGMMLPLGLEGHWQELVGRSPTQLAASIAAWQKSSFTFGVFVLIKASEYQKGLKLPANPRYRD